jgi:Protein of unknown function (DUF3024)
VLPQADVERLRAFCAERVPAHVREQLRVECEEDPRAVTVVELSPPWREEDGPEWMRMPVARFRYVRSTRLWTLYWHRQTGRWERHPFLASNTRIGPLLEELERDPLCIFWG